MVAAGFEDVVEADEVALDVGIGVGDGVAHARLGSEVHDQGEALLGEEAFDQSLVGQVALDEAPVASQRVDFAQALLLESDVIVVIERVEPDHPDVLHVRKQTLYQVGPNETRRAGHQHGL